MNLKHVIKQVVAASGALFFLSAAPCAHAATYTVDRTDDAAISTCSATSNDCSLRGAITAANATAGADTINFNATAFAAPGPHVISLTTALPSLNDDVTITGPGVGLLTVKETGTNRLLSLLTVDSGVSATVSGLTLSNGYEGIRNDGALTATNCTLNGNDYDGIRNYGGTLTATNCTLSGNTGDGIANVTGTATATDCTLSGNGHNGIVNGAGSSTVTVTNCTLSGNAYAAIHNYGTVTATNCTLSGNRYGIRNNSNYGTVTATNCTLSGNTDTGIFNYGGTMTATNCTLSGNSIGIYSYRNINSIGTTTLNNTLVAGNTTNVSGPFTDGGHNITSGTATVAGLDPAGLQDNGGPTETIALIAGSPAIDAGNSTLTTDQRGFNRPSGSASDIGAFELGGLPALSVNNPRSLPEGSASAPGSTTFDITLNAASTQSVTVNYQTRDGINSPAIAGIDYIAKSGKLTFAPGETLKRVTIQFIGDDIAEPKETFFLDLKTPTNAVIADGRGVGTIANDDAAALLFNNDEPSQ